jgi:hypothetical protein
MEKLFRGTFYIFCKMNWRVKMTVKNIHIYMDKLLKRIYLVSNLCLGEMQLLRPRKLSGNEVRNILCT